MNANRDTRALGDAELDTVNGGGLRNAIALGVGMGIQGGGCGGIAAGPAGAVVGGLLGGAGGFVAGLFISDDAATGHGSGRRVLR